MNRISTRPEPVKGSRVSGVFLNASEIERLNNVPILARALYLAIRETIDFNTGYAGMQCPVSWEGYAKTLSTPSRRGFAGETFTIQQLKRTVKHLENSGLITNHSIKSQHKLILRCPVAVGQSPNAKSDQETQQPRTLRAIDGGKAERENPKAERENDQRPSERPNAKRHHKTEENPVFSRTEEVKVGRKAERENDQRPDNIRDTTRLDKICNTRTREKIAPEHFMDLVDYFTTQADYKFPNHKVHTASNVPRFKTWIDMAATYDEIETAIAVAHTQLGGPPGSPAYYDRVLKSLRNTQQQAAQEQLIDQQNPTIRTGGRTHAKPTTPAERRRIFESGYHPDQNRKLTPGERSRVAYGTDPVTLRKFDEQDQHDCRDDDAIDGHAWAVE